MRTNHIPSIQVVVEIMTKTAHTQQLAHTARTQNSCKILLETSLDSMTSYIFYAYMKINEFRSRF